MATKKMRYALCLGVGKVLIFVIVKINNNSISPTKNAKFEGITLIKMLTLFRVGLFGAAHRSRGQKSPLSKVCHSYPTIIKLSTVKLLPKEDPKNR